MLDGADKLIANLERVLKEQPEILAGALVQEAESIMTEAKQETPVDTGALRSSGHVQTPKFSGDSVSVELGFGGPAAGYAVFVHENLEASHPTGKAKFLEDPFNRHAATMDDRIGKRLEKALK